ncbi:hypothetical protein Tco_1345570 [Tanacetum coccineum]
MTGIVFESSSTMAPARQLSPALVQKLTASSQNAVNCLDAAFKPSPQTLISLPTPDSAASPSQEILEQASSTTTPTTSETEPCVPTKDSDKGFHTTSEATKKTAKRELFPDTEAAQKKPRQET